MKNNIPYMKVHQEKEDDFSSGDVIKEQKEQSEQSLLLKQLSDKINLMEKQISSLQNQLSKANEKLSKKDELNIENDFKDIPLLVVKAVNPPKDVNAIQEVTNLEDSFNSMKYSRIFKNR